jgi:hypothetical protein
MIVNNASLAILNTKIDATNVQKIVMNASYSRIIGTLKCLIIIFFIFIFILKKGNFKGIVLISSIIN